MKVLYFTIVSLIMITLIFDLIESKGRIGSSRSGGSISSSRSGSGSISSSRSGSGSRSSSSRLVGSIRSRSRTVRSSRSNSRLVGSSKSGIQSGNTVKVNKYNTWATRYNIRTEYRYGSASYYQKREALLAGMILMSHHHHVTYYDSRDSLDRVSVCMSLSNMYNRNITVSPYFLCPWYKDPSYRYCCGDEYEQYCCRYFDRSSQKSWLVILILGLIIFLIVSIYFWWKKCGKCKSSSTIVKLYKAKAIPINNKYDVNISTEFMDPPYPMECPPNDCINAIYHINDDPEMCLPEVDSHRNSASAPYENDPIGYNSSGPTNSVTPDNSNSTSPHSSCRSIVNSNDK